MNEIIEISPATSADIDFVIDTIIEAEKSGTEKMSFCNIFSMTEPEVRLLLKRILEKDVTGQELSYSEYLICRVDGEYAGACTSWIEEENGYSAALLKADLLFDFVEREKLIEAQRIFSLIQGVNIEREPGTLQIAYAYVKPKFRGRGIIGLLMNEHIKNQKNRVPGINKAQLRITKTNENAARAYEKIGFVKIYERTVDNDEILKILPAKTKILMEKTF
ncbi:MAG TPA: GNAT family N-acetyltransferase [Ignavibacteriaceae bacterium]|jgi:ribosomal protein S18 acetylase RimI-like enzyme|nr:GNAT family N-acetyltransferase [Ignavibacteriaceae bacterium]